MTAPSRTSPRPATLVLTLLVALVATALAGCGSDQPTARASSPTSPSVSASSSASASPSPADEPTDEATDEAPSTGDVQVIKVDKFGVSFELPKGWITLNARKVLKSTGPNPVLDELASRLGTTREQLVQQFSAYLQTMSVSDEGAIHGFLDNVNSVGQEGDVNDDQLKLQLATVGAKPGALHHQTTDAGDVTVVHYTLSTKTGLTIRAIALAVRTGAATVVLTVSSSSDQRATKIADQVLASLKKIAGSGPNA
jgi:hypothetical protein